MQPQTPGTSQNSAQSAPRWRPYAIAVALCLVTLLLRLGMLSWDGGQSFLIIFLFPIVISAYIGGLGPGLLATAIVGALTDYYLAPPVGSFSIASPIAFA